MPIAFRSGTNSRKTAGTQAGAVTVTRPAGVVEKDLLFAFLTINEGQTIPTPAGWTSLPMPVNVVRYGFYKVAGAAEPTTYTFTIDNSSTAQVDVVAVAYLGAHPTAPVVSSSFVAGTSACPAATAPATNTTEHLTLRVHLGGYDRAETLVNPAATTLRQRNDASVIPNGVADEPVTGTAVAASGDWTYSPGQGILNAARRSGTIIVAPGNLAPNAPTGLSPTGNGTLDRTVSQRFSWTFSDPNPGDSQSKYDLGYRLVGAGTFTVVTGTTPNQFHDFAGAFFAAGQYEWQVRTYDALLVGPYSASGFFTAGITPNAPTITDPINNATLAASTYTLTWSSPDQDAYQVRRVADAAGVADTAVVYSDSGTVESATTRSHALAFAVNNRNEHLQVRVRKSGLWSVYASVRVLISFTPPATPTVVVTPSSATATIAVAITNPPPAGGQPTVVSHDVRRRQGGVGEGVRIVTLLAAGATFTDRTPASGVDYSYLVVAVGANGTSASSVWTG